jgi:hypothetical protein
MMDSIKPSHPRLLAFGLFTGGGLTEDAVALSAPGLAGMAAAISESFKLYPIVAQQQLEFYGPGLRAGQVGEKCARAGPGVFLSTHGFCSTPLVLVVSVATAAGDNVQVELS